MSVLSTITQLAGRAVYVGSKHSFGELGEEADVHISAQLFVIVPGLAVLVYVLV